ncbi:MAG: ABC transporter substrate-binding protein [Eubacteriales bacterium]|nr:ABC transporter substrate-binding protein [Eubacteriales bacterium]
MKNTTKKIMSLMLSTGVAVGMLAGSTVFVQAEEQELTKITFCLDWTPNTNHTGIYAAQALGYYEEAGLEVEIVQPPENGAVLMCAAGQAQFAVDAQDTLAASLALDDPLGITAVAAMVQHNTSGIISRAGEGIDKPAGLTGKTYSTWESPIELAILENLVNADGGDFSQVELIPNDITDEPAALAAHQTDAIWVFEGWGRVTADIEGVDVDYFNFRDINSVFDYYTPVLIANNEFLEESPEIAKAFVAATAKGYEYAAENPKEAADMLIAGDNTGSLGGSEELVYKSQEYLSSKYVDDAKSWGVIDPARWDGFYGWLYENELCAKDLIGVGYTNDFLPE